MANWSRGWIILLITNFAVLTGALAFGADRSVSRALAYKILLLEFGKRSSGGTVQPFEVTNLAQSPDDSTLVISYRITIGEEGDFTSPARNRIEGSAQFVRQDGQWQMLRVTRKTQTLEFEVPRLVEGASPGEKPRKGVDSEQRSISRSGIEDESN